jgi:3-dehydrotetronate 4-kinase
MGLLLGAIADDFTGATDLCNTLVRRGMRTVQLIDVPAEGWAAPDAEAVVVALKSRTIPAPEAIDKSLAALAWLQHAGARQILFKYCSTFDSTDAGNIGPVAEALIEALDTDFTLFCPAFPEAGRTIYKGYLFVGDVLLSESGMRDHPLTPMRDPSLVRVLQRQCQGKVGLVPEAAVAQGAGAVRDAFAALHQAGFRHAIVDAIEDRDLEAIGEAAADFKFITGGSGIALGLPENFRRRGLLGDSAAADSLPAISGPAAVLSGSCSTATLAQVAHMSQRARPLRSTRLPPPKAGWRNRRSPGQSRFLARNRS